MVRGGAGSDVHISKWCEVISRTKLSRAAAVLSSSSSSFPPPSVEMCALTDRGGEMMTFAALSLSLSLSPMFLFFFSFPWQWLICAKDGWNSSSRLVQKNQILVSWSEKRKIMLWKKIMSGVYLKGGREEGVALFERFFDKWAICRVVAHKLCTEFFCVSFILAWRQEKKSSTTLVQ